MDPLTIVALFGAGIASFLAPCVVPMVPAYLAMLGSSAGEEGSAARPGAGLLEGTLLFVAGFTSVFVAFGALAGRLGSALTQVQDTVERLGGLALVVFGLALLRGRLLRTVRPLESSGLLARVAPTGGSGARARVLRPLALGVTFGAAWTPCVGPLLGAALVLAADSGGTVEGSVLLAAYGAGVGLPFLAIAVAASTHDRVLARVRRWSQRIQAVSGVALVVLGVLLLTGRYGAVSSTLARFAPDPPVS